MSEENAPQKERYLREVEQKLLRKELDARLGADDFVRPQTAPDFFEILGEFATAQWADVGIGPYNEMGKCLRFRRKFSKTHCFLPGGAEPRPYQGLGKIALLCRF